MRITKKLRIVLDSTSPNVKKNIATVVADNGFSIITTSLVSQRSRKLRFNGFDGVDPSDNSITVFAHGLSTGDQVQYSFISFDNVPVGGLTNGSVYYAINVTNNKIKLATTLQNAQSNTPITLTVPAGILADHYLELINNNQYNVIRQYDFNIGQSFTQFNPNEKVRIAVESFVWKNNTNQFQGYDAGFIGMGNMLFKDVHYNNNSSLAPIRQGICPMTYLNFVNDIDYRNDNIITNSYALNEYGITAIMQGTFGVVVNQGTRLGALITTAGSKGDNFVIGNIDGNPFILTFIVYAYEDDDNN